MYKSPEELDTFFKALYSFKKIKILGEGAFGLAVLAFDETEQIKKVFKLPKSHKMTDALQVEGTNLVKLRNLLHKNIIQLYQYGFVEIETDGRMEKRYYLCLAFGGGSLREVLGDLKMKLDKDGNPHFEGSGHFLPVEQAVEIAIDICQGLEAAHGFRDSDIRIIHRDIKPENILIDDETGVARIVDFGVSRVIDQSIGMASVAGTLLYMDPECFKGQAGPYSDIYSFGIVLYEMLTGNLPFPNFPSRIQSEPEDPRLYNPEISDELAHIVLTAIDNDLSVRYANAPEILKDLRSVYSILNPLPLRYNKIKTVSSGCFLCKDKDTDNQVIVRLFETDIGPDEIDAEAAKLLESETLGAAEGAAGNIVLPLHCFQNEHILGIISPLPVGRPLDEAFAPIPISSADILDKICKQIASICDIVAEINDVGVIHGFLSPGLIYIDDQENITIHGFLAAPVLRKRASAVRKAGAFLQTFSDHLPFMSPQLLSGDIPPCVIDDVFSIGAILYFLVTGKHHAEKDIIDSIVAGKPFALTLQDPGELNPIVTAKLFSIISGALDRDGRNRPADTRKIAALLRDCRWPEDIVDSLVERALDTYEAGDFLEACDIIQKALETDPGNPRIHFAMGLIYYKENEYRWAVEELWKASMVEPAQDIYVVLGRCYMEWNGQNEKAAEMFANALNFGDDPEIRNLHAKAIKVE